MKPKNLTKDQIQKIILSALGFVALIYCYFNFFLGPLNKSRASMTATIAARGNTQAGPASARAQFQADERIEGASLGVWDCSSLLHGQR